MSRPPRDDSAEAETLDSHPARDRADAETIVQQEKRKRDRRRRLARRHPDIEVARLLVKRGYIDKARGVECLKIQKARAKAGKKRIPFLKLLLKKRVLDQENVLRAQDEIRRHTYICEACEARAIVLAGSQSRAGVCPRCGNEISVEAAVGSAFAVPPRDFTERSEGVPSSATMTWRAFGSRRLAALPSGQVSFERYLIEEEIGRGAMGVVYRAKHLQLNKRVALKVLFPTEDGWEHQVARFRREAAAVQKLRHPGIVPVHDFGTDGEIYYLTMDLVEGGDTLHRRLKDAEEPLSLARRLDILMQVARAVHHAHEQGVVHRDLKPANVLLAGDGRALVADFGLAKDDEAEAGELTRTHDRLGTPLFMAPEQIRKGASTVDARADVWAMGVMLFASLTGRYPFRSRTVMDLYLRILREQPDWTGTLYSAPDRAGYRPPPEPPVSKSATPGVASTHAGSADDSCERTEISTRDDKGNIPKVIAAEAPPPARPVPPRNAPPFVAPVEFAERSVPAGLKAVVMGALAKDPEDRYPSAAAFADDIARYLAGEKVEGRGPKLLKRVRERFWQRRVVRATLAALALLVLLSAGGGYLAWRRAKVLAVDRQVQQLWLQANQAGDDDAYVRAEMALNDLLKEHPRQPRALLRLGLARARQVRLEEARRDLLRAAEAARDRGEPALRCEIAAARAQHELMAGNVREALTAASRALELAEQLGEACPVPSFELVGHFTLAAVATGDPASQAEAESLCERACVNPGVPRRIRAYWVQLARLRGDAETAWQRLRDAEAFVPNPRERHHEIVLARALLLLAAEDPAAEEALGEAGRALGRADAQIQTLLDRGHTLARGSGEWEQLLAVNRAGARLSPWTAKFHYYAANTLINRLGAGEEALAHYRQAHALDPFDTLARECVLASLLAGEDPARVAEAATVCEADERLQSKWMVAPLELGFIRLRQGRLAEAWEAFDRADARTHPSQRRRGFRSAAGRAALMRLLPGAEAEAREALTRVPTWKEQEPETLERGYYAQASLHRLQDHVNAARAHLAGAQPQLALRALEWGMKQRVDGRRGSLQTAVALGLRVRALGALGRPDEALEVLTQQLANEHTLSPELVPALLESLPELESLRADTRFQDLLAQLRTRGRG